MKNIGWCPERCEDRILNLRETNKFDVFIGRGSKWGNPFPNTDTCSRERGDERVGRFRRPTRSTPTAGPAGLHRQPTDPASTKRHGY